MSEYSASCSEWYVISESGKPAMSTRSTRRQPKSEVEPYIIASKSDESQNDPSANVISELPILIEKLELEESKNIELSQKIEFLEEQNNQLEDLNSSLIEDRVWNSSDALLQLLQQGRQRNDLPRVDCKPDMMSATSLTNHIPFSRV